MKAIVMPRHGDPDVLTLRDIDQPELPSPHHLRVKLSGAGVNPVDTKLRARPIYGSGTLPAILGCDGAGIVEDAGTAVTRFKVGDAVFFNNGGIGDVPGCYAEFTTVHEEYCAAAPKNIEVEDAAGLPLALITAWEALFERISLQPGHTILIHGGTGGVGHIALQLASHVGARVAVTIGSKRKAALAQALGAVKAIPYHEMDFVGQIMQWTGGNGVDAVLDTVGGDVFRRSLSVARIGGNVVTLLATPIAIEDVQLARLRNLSICYEMMLAPQLMKLHDERIRQRRILEQGARLIEAGNLGVFVSKRLTMKDASQAHRMLEEGGRDGEDRADDRLA